MRFSFPLAVCFAAALAACAPAPKPAAILAPPPACVSDAPESGCVQTGAASFYANSLAGNATASGEPYRPGARTAAHPSFPLGSRIAVSNLANGREVVVRVNDRGPYAHGRILDLSRRAAHDLGFIRDGQADIRIRYLGE